MKQFTREELEQELLDNDCNTIEQMVFQSDLSYLESILLNGFKGYAHFTDEELIREYKEVFNEPELEIEII